MTGKAINGVGKISQIYVYYGEPIIFIATLLNYAKVKGAVQMYLLLTLLAVVLELDKVFFFMFEAEF